VPLLLGEQRIASRSPVRVERQRRVEIPRQFTAWLAMSLLDGSVSAEIYECCQGVWQKRI